MTEQPSLSRLWKALFIVIILVFSGILGTVLFWSLKIRTTLTNIVEAIPNYDFSRGLEDWEIKPTGSVLEVYFDRNESYDEKPGSLKIIHKGSGDWSMTYKRRLAVAPGDYFIFHAAVKCSFNDRKSWGKISAIALNSRDTPINLGRLGRWRAGDFAFCGNWNWRRMDSFFRIPNGGAWLGIKIEGHGPGTMWIDGIKLERGIPEGVILSAEINLKKEYTAATLYKYISLGDYAGSVLRIGDLNGDGKPEFVTVQNKNLGRGNIYRMITCITAIDLEGKVLWIKGEPDIENFSVESDLPIQVYDLDGDGRDEVICAMNFEILVLDGETGEVKIRAPTPISEPGEGWGEGPETKFSNIIGDSIIICNLQGLTRPQDFILKDRYNNMWAYDKNLRKLWHYTGKLAHFPKVYDLDGDGRDEVFTGDAMLDDDGEILWRIDLYDHCDSILIGEIDSQPGPDLIIANSDGGFYWIDALTGRIKREWHLGHAQSVSLANFREDIEGLEISAHTSWGGRYWFMFDRDGNMLQADFERIPGWVPVNWMGDGEELIASSHQLYDGFNRPVITLPGSEGGNVWVYDVCGDLRDEVIVWNKYSIQIYTQAEPFQGKLIYAPKRALYQQTFYGCFQSEPYWTEYEEE